MIGRLTGVLLEKQPPHILVDVNGVGYEAEAPMSTFYRLPELGNKVVLHTHLVVREDAQLLFAFAEKRDRELFRELIKLNGVGPKLALALMSGLEVDELIAAVHAQDTSALMRVPGVGKKTADRLLVELNGKFKAWEGLASKTSAPAPGIAVSPAAASTDAVSALIALGYKPQEASRAVASIKEEGLSSEELIRRALKGVG